MKNSVIIISLSIVMLMMLSIFLYVNKITPSIQKIDQKITGEDSAGTIIQGSTIVIYNTPHKEESEISRLQIQYVRAFGAYRVPLMMKYILSKYKNVDVVNAAPEFRKQWEERFKTLYAVRSEAWDEIEKEDFSGKSLYSKIVNPVKGDIIKFYLNNIKYSSDRYRRVQEIEAVKFFEEKFHMTVPQDWENELDGANESDIGFLFIIVENNTEKSCYNINFSYDLIKNNVMPNEQLGPGYESANLDWKKQNSNALTDETLKNAKKIPLDKRMSQLKPGESVIWLLHTYKSKDDGMPEYYLTDIEIPRKITFMTNGKTMEQDVRAPYGLQAARMHLPKDWMSMKIWMGQ